MAFKRSGTAMHSAASAFHSMVALVAVRPLLAAAPHPANLGVHSVLLSDPELQIGGGAAEGDPDPELHQESNDEPLGVPPESPTRNQAESTAFNVNFTEALQIHITVFGRLGGANSTPSKASLQNVSRWFFATLLTSFFETNDASDFTLLPDDLRGSIFSEQAVLQPLAIDRYYLEDRRSVFLRTVFSFNVTQIRDGTAQPVIERLCGDYAMETQTLLNALFRCLSLSDLYPAEGVWASTIRNTTTKSVVLLTAAGLDKDGSVLEECNLRQRGGGEQLEFLLPDCPAHSSRCDRVPGLCAADAPELESVCGCDKGYAGRIVVVVGEKSFFEGTCEVADAYCPNTDGQNPLSVVPGGASATGTLGEVAHSICQDGYRPRGTAVCVEGSTTVGQWRTKSQLGLGCDFIPINKPPPPRCTPPSGLGLNSIGDCRDFVGSLSGGCQASCDTGYRQMDNNGFGYALTCVLSRHSCVPEENLSWNGSAPEGGRCTLRSDGTVESDFCCSEAWGVNKPRNLTPGDCRSITHDELCQRSKQDGGTFSGAPCCWNEHGFGTSSLQCIPFGADGSDQATACAVPPYVPSGEWEKVPTCQKECTNSFVEFVDYLDGVHGCSGLIPGESCPVTCTSPYTRYGGGPEGHRTCNPDTLDFGSVPLCLELPLLRCSAPADPSLSAERCQGRELNASGCLITCAPGFINVSGDPAAVDRVCEPFDADLRVGECDSLTDVEACVETKTHTAGGAEAPCCFRAERFSDNRSVCLPMGHSAITTDSVPDVCGSLREARYRLPDCSQICPNIYEGVDDIVYSSGCDRCATDLECSCEVRCADGAEYFGGSPQGQKRCHGRDMAFDPAPTCRPPQRGESRDSNLPGCIPPAPKWTVVTGCLYCFPLQPGCQCSVSCADGFKNVGPADGVPGTEEGSRACSVVELQLSSVTDCETITDRNLCLESSQPSASSAQTPCCWREEGFSAAGGGPTCAYRGSSTIELAPTACASIVDADFGTMPLCYPKCEAPAGWLSDNLDISPSIAACEDCVAGRPCNCSVSCRDGFERYGGGLEGPRSCELSDLAFEAAPTCLTPEAMPLCMEPSPTAALVYSDCGDCVAGSSSCGCTATCAPTYERFGGPLEGSLDCLLAQNDNRTGVCENQDMNGCLSTKEGSSPCCWLPSEERCLPKGASAITPDSSVTCAPLLRGQWSGEPDCRPLCINEFDTAENVVAMNCDRCFVGESCACEAFCRNDTIEITDRRARLPHYRACGHIPGAPQSFGAVPRCVLRQPPEIPMCSAPADPALLAANCTDCLAGFSNCSCTVRCAAGYKHMGGAVGPKACNRETYVCPRIPEWVEPVCYDGETYEAVNVRCCGEYYGQILLGRRTTCKSVVEKSECLHREDAETGKPCCWNPVGFGGAGGPKCMPGEDPSIGPDSPAQACANRPEVFKAVWDPMPTCAATCPNRFERMDTVVATNCDACVAGEPAGAEACACDVRCKAHLEHYGGPAEGSILCDSSTGTFPIAPICRPPPAPPVCSQLGAAGLDVTGCTSAGAPIGTVCHVACASNYFSHAGGEGPRTCTSVPTSLDTKDCRSLRSADSCLNAKDTSSGMPCCFRGQSLNHNGSVCLPKGSVDITSLDPQPTCAPVDEAVWEPADRGSPYLLSCVRTCDGLPSSERLSSAGCENCTVGEPQFCSCEVHCKPGFYFVSGGREGRRHCIDHHGSVNVHASQPAWNVSLPICAPIPPPPTCARPETPGDPFLSHGCDACSSTGDGCPNCTIECKPGHAKVPATDGLRPRCVWRNYTDGPDVCNTITLKANCVVSREGNLPCCWSDIDQVCGQVGTLTAPEEPRCATTSFGVWTDLPMCAQICSVTTDTHGRNEVVATDCDGCLVGQPCSCMLTCPAGTLRFGGGPEGPRQCDPASGLFEDPPVCSAPPPPVCPKPSDSSLKVEGCWGCEAGSTDCACEVNCADGFRLASGQEGSKRCVETGAADFDETVCETETFKSACLNSMEGGTPCCWGDLPFGNGRSCAARGSSVITQDRPHAVCAQATAAAFGDLPFCSDFCSDAIFAGAPNVVATGCDNCLVGGTCDCEVVCAEGFMAAPQGPRPGRRQCLLAGGTWAFEAPPRCKKPCDQIDDAFGTLAASNCGSDACVVDEPCDCEVFCAEGNALVGGREENKICDSDGAYSDLPTCRPRCTTPDPPPLGVVITGCQEPCISTDASMSFPCSCTLHCNGMHRNGLEGSKLCKLVPGRRASNGNAAVPSKGIWVDSMDQDVQIDQLPGCSYAIQLRVVSNHKGSPIAGVRVLIYNDRGRTQLEKDGRTDDSGILEYWPRFDEMTIEIPTFIQGFIYKYLPQIRTFNRAINCFDPEECMITMSLQLRESPSSREPRPARVDADCNVYLKPGEEAWTMTAALTWDDDWSNMDLIARSYTAFEPVGERFGCLNGDLPPGCKRALFKKDDYFVNQMLEWSASGTFRVDRGWPLMLNNRQVGMARSPTWAAYNPSVFSTRQTRVWDQLTKWVHEKVQIAKDLTWKAIGLPPGHVWRQMVAGLEGWTPENWIMHLVSATGGQGPETIQFNNVPPGLYQIIANIYNSPKNTRPRIHQSHPKVRLFISRDLEFECGIPDDCAYSARLWYVANINVSHEFTAEFDSDGQPVRKYKIRILESSHTMQRLWMSDMATNPAYEMLNMESDRQRRDAYDFILREWFQPFTGRPNDADRVQTDEQLKNVCHGKCTFVGRPEFASQGDGCFR